MVRRFGRMFFLLAVGLSLMVCAGAVVMWVWSYFATPWVAQYDGERERHAAVSRGQLQVLTGEDTFAGTPAGEVGLAA